MKRKKKEEPDNTERWVVSYADFITLLFAFFTVMYATSQADLDKRASFEKSIKKAFGMFQTSGGGDKGIMTEPFPSYTKDGSVVDPQIKLFVDQRASNAEKKDALWQLIDQKLTKEQIQQAGLNVRDDEDGVRISFDASKLFDPGSAKILPDALRSLDVVGSILKNAQKRLVVEGHTDNETISSNLFPSNWELAAARASIIVRYLIKRHHVPADLLTVVSYADQKPLVPNDTPANKAKNRRIEILISTK